MSSTFTDTKRHILRNCLVSSCSWLIGTRNSYMIASLKNEYWWPHIIFLTPDSYPEFKQSCFQVYARALKSPPSSSPAVCLCVALITLLINSLLPRYLAEDPLRTFPLTAYYNLRHLLQYTLWSSPNVLRHRYSKKNGNYITCFKSVPNGFQVTYINRMEAWTAEKAFI